MQVIQRITITATLALAATAMLQAQAQLDPATRMFLQPQAQHVPAPSEAQTGEISVYVQIDTDAIDWQAIHDLGGHVGTIAKQGSSHESGVRNEGTSLATVRIPISHLADLAQVPGIRYIQAPQAVKPMLDLARKEARADEAYSSLLIPDSSMPYTGQGIVIGQVDAGIDYQHNAFKTPDGELRIKRVWEQGTNPATASIYGLHSPEAFGYGAEFDTAELILKAGADSDAGSHGTHVMGIAAGSDTYLDGQFRGVAPEAELVMVAISDVGPDNVRISDAIQYIFDYADQVQKPCVINLSLGSHSGPHDGTSPFDQIADALQGPGRLIVGAAGNYGADKFHLSRTYAEGSELVPFQTIVNHEFYSSYATGQVDIWADATLPLAIELFDYGTFNGTESETQTFLLPDQLDGQMVEVSLGRNVSGTLQLTGELNPLNGKQHVLLTSAVTNLRNNHLVGLRITPLGGHGQVDLWADDAKIHFNAAAREGFINPTDESTITELGGTAQRILSVGAYTTRDKFVLEGSDEVYNVSGQTLNDLCDFSGYGPTADGRQKPEVCAPGSFIVSAVSGYEYAGSIYMHSHYTDAKGHPQRYGYLHGTSMSAPFVTGAVALWLQAYPQMTPEELKEIIAQSTRLDDFTLDTRYWGSGKIDVLAGLQRSIELGGGNAIEQIEAPVVAPESIFDAAGHRVAASMGQLSQGFYVVRKGNRSGKVMIR